MKNQTVMKRMIITFLIVMLMMSTSITSAFAVEQTIKSTVINEGDLRVTTTTIKEDGSNFQNQKTVKKIENILTGEIAMLGENIYENENNGISVFSKTEKKTTDGVMSSKGRLCGTYNTSVFITTNKDTELKIDITENKIERLLDSMGVAISELSYDPELKVTAELTTKMPNLKTFTMSIPKAVLKKICEYKECSLKVSSVFGSVELDNKVLASLLKGKAENITITLADAGSDEQKGIRVTVNNGTQVFDLNDGNAIIGVAYSGGFGLDPERIRISHLGNSAKDITVTENITYNSDSHEINLGCDELGDYMVKIADVIFEDTKGHWAKPAIDKWSDLGIVTGYNGNFNPNENIKRGDMAVMLDKLMNYKAASKNTFTDLKGTEYYAQAILKANELGVIGGSENQARPMEDITREEAAVMIGKAFGIAPAGKCSTQFSDDKNISGWAKEYLYALVNKGVLSGDNGKVNPKNPITRSETVTIFNNMVAKLINYGTYSKDVKGTVLINGGDTVLKDMTVYGDLIIGDGVAENEVILENVTVHGATLVRGGGTASIHVNGDSNLENMSINKRTGAIRIVAENTASIKNVQVSGGSGQVILEGSMDKVCLDSPVPVKFQKLTLKDLQINAADSKLIIDSMSEVEKSEITDSAKNVSIDVSGQVAQIAANGENATVEGTGLVDSVTAGADNIKIKTSGTKVIVAKNINGTIAGKTVIEGGTIGSVPGNKPSVSSSGKVSESVSVFAPTIKTNLTDGKIVKGSNLNFDLFATSVSGKKISDGNCVVKINDIEIKRTWDDSDKTSYSLKLKEGKNTIEITATDDGETTKKNYMITYEPGELKAVVAVELFSLGRGYLIEPVTVTFSENENAAKVLTDLLKSKGFEYANTGSLKNGFYLETINGVGDKALSSLEFAPEYIKKCLNESGFSKEDCGWERAYADEDALGEFDYTNGSGWMYSVNNNFPNLGFSQYHLQDGDVMRVQFTLAYGADIGGSGSLGTGTAASFYEVANRDEITKKYAGRNTDSILFLMQQLDASQSKIDKL